MKKITIGARGSKLSSAYVEKVKNLILKTSEKLGNNDILFKKIRTTGDLNPNTKISELGGKNLFCKEIEEDLLKKDIDIAVHSLKDMESKEHKDLTIGAFVKRNDPRDILISHKIKKLSDLKDGTTIGSSSRRRELQLKNINHNIKVEYLRGNIDTRIKKLGEKNLDAIILAAAGVKSLKLEDKIGLIFETKEILPAVGQGILAVQCRKNDEYIKEILKSINDKETSICAIAERKMLEIIGGDCDTAIGGFAEINNKKLKLKAQLFSDSGNESFVYEFTGSDTEPLIIGKTVGQKLLDLAGKKYSRK